MDPLERRFLDGLESDLRLERHVTAGLLAAMLVKNSI
jgi:hypothetical protein